jgi:hypothetical protein
MTDILNSALYWAASDAGKKVDRGDDKDGREFDRDATSLVQLDRHADLT